jgi:N-acetylglucosaminyl-diphospho-decaprenol L-rhamnosyltransferase
VTVASAPARTAVVVVNYGSHRLLAENLPGLGGRPDTAVVVVDSRHSDAERNAVTGLAADHGWVLVPLAGNPGFGAAVNAGVDRARELGAQTVVLLNPDAVLPMTALDGLVAAVADDPRALVCPLVEDAGGAVWFAGGSLDWADGRTRTRGVDVTTVEHPWVTGACLAFSLALWDEVGGFDDRYFMYWEDIDLSHRVQAAGGRLVVRRDLVATHLVGGTQAGEGKSDLYLRYNCRNRLLFAAQHLQDDELAGWLRSSPAHARRVLLRGGRRALLRRPVGQVLAAVRGTVEGLLLVRSVRAGGPAARATSVGVTPTPV